MEDYTSLLKILKISYGEMLRPLSLEEATKLPQKPMKAYEYLLYVEKTVSQCIRALQQIPQFKNLSAVNRVKLLKVRVVLITVVRQSLANRDGVIYLCVCVCVRLR